MKNILFSTPMVRAILEGKKTQTRRVIKPQPYFTESSSRWTWKIPKSKILVTDELFDASRSWHEYLNPKQYPHKVGNILWVRETWAKVNNKYIYLADSKNGLQACPMKPSIHMPREAARLFIKITGVRVERLQDISEADAKAEGVSRDHRMMMYAGMGKASIEMLERVYRDEFILLWNDINAKRGYSWESNPWVFCYSFERVEV